MVLIELQASVRIQCCDNWLRQLAEPEFSRALASDQTRGMDVFVLSALGSASKTQKQDLQETAFSLWPCTGGHSPQHTGGSMSSHIGRAAVRRLAEQF